MIDTRKDVRQNLIEMVRDIRWDRREILRWAVVIYAELFLLWSLFHTVLWKLPYLTWFKVAGIAILIGAVWCTCMEVRTDNGFGNRILSLLRHMFCYEQVYLIALFLWFLLVCMIRNGMDGGDYFYHNRDSIFITELSALVLFPLAEYLGPKRARRTIEGMMHFTVVLYTFFSMWSLHKYLRMEFITYPSGSKLEIYKNVAMMMGSHRNVTGAFAALFFCICVYMIMTQKLPVRILYIPAALVHAMVMFLSNSRGSYYAAMGVIGLTALIYAWDFLDMKEIRERIFGSAFASLSGCLILSELRTLAFDYAKKSFTKVAETAKAAEKVAKPAAEAAKEAVKETAKTTGTSASTEAKEIAKKMVARETLGLNGRESIWKACRQLLNSGPANRYLGVTPCKVRKMMMEVGGLKFSMPHAHNVVLQIGVSLGVIAMALEVIFLLLIVVRGFRIVINRKRFSRNAWMIPVLLVCMYIMDTVEVTTFATGWATLPVFYLFAGLLASMDRRARKRSKRTAAEDLHPSG